MEFDQDTAAQLSNMNCYGNDLVRHLSGKDSIRRAEAPRTKSVCACVSACCDVKNETTKDFKMSPTFNVSHKLYNSKQIGWGKNKCRIQCSVFLATHLPSIKGG